MTPSSIIRKTSWALWLPLAAATVFAQATATQKPTQKPFEPTVGQPGKDVVWVPTPQPLVDKMLDLAKVTAADVVYDLGSGDGRTVITAAKRGAKAVGVEYNPDMVDLSKKNAAAAGVTDKATFMKADLFETDFSQATVVTMFLLPDINLKLRPKILDMKPGTRVVSNTFTMDDWEPDMKETVTDNCSSWCTALFWVVPAKVDGKWTLNGSALTVSQKFQKFTGTLGSQQIANGWLRGDAISFSVGSAKYSGRVAGSAMQGTASGGTATSWKATR